MKIPNLDPRSANVVARQPILNASGQVFAYELLYRCDDRGQGDGAGADVEAARVVSDVVSGIGLGAPKILPSALGTIVRWESLATATVPKTPGTPFAGTCYQWGGAGYATSGCEHFGMSLRANAIRAITRWLIDNPDAPGTLVAYNPPTPVAIPSYIVIAPVVAGNPPVVQAEVQDPEPPEAPERFGDAQWVKIFVQQLPQEVTLEQLTSDNPTIVPLDPAQTEVSWDVLQQDPPSNSNGNQRRNRRQVQGSLKADTRTVVRRIELYNFTGQYDPITHEVLCADLTCTAPGVGELGDFVSANMTAVLVQPDSLIVSLVGKGNVDSSDKLISCGSKCVSPYVGGTVTTLTAKAASGSVFTGWTGACATFAANPTCTIPVNGITGVTATFTATTTGGGGGGGGTTTGGGGGGGGTTATSFTLSVAKSNKGTVTANAGTINCGGTCSAKYNAGSTVVLTATPPTGLAFLGWTGACAGTGTCTVTINADTKVQANFSK